MTQVAAIVTFKAQPGKGAEVARLVGAALPKALDETPMPLWLGLHSEANPDIVHIGDVFVNVACRHNHLRDQTADRILAQGPPQLTEATSNRPLVLITRK